ncbi:MAG: RNA polymerase sigma factor [Flavonifractor plautii]
METWLVRIVINVCKRQLRSPWRLLRAPQESLDSLRMEGPEPPDDTLVRAIQALPPKYREVIILYYYQEWKALGDRPEAARSGLHRDGTALTGPGTAEGTSEGVVL